MPRKPNPALDALRRNVSGKVASGEAESIVEIPAPAYDVDLIAAAEAVRALADERAARSHTDKAIAEEDRLKALAARLDQRAAGH